MLDAQLQVACSKLQTKLSAKEEAGVCGQGAVASSCSGQAAVAPWQPTLRDGYRSTQTMSHQLVIEVSDDSSSQNPFLSGARLRAIGEQTGTIITTERRGNANAGAATCALTIFGP